MKDHHQRKQQYLVVNDVKIRETMDRDVVRLSIVPTDYDGLLPQDEVPLDLSSSDSDSDQEALRNQNEEEWILIEQRALASSSYLPNSLISFDRYYSLKELSDVLDFTLDAPSSPKVILTKERAKMIRSFLPERKRISTHWFLNYATFLNGVSFWTLLDKLSEHNEPTIFVIRDTDENVFGFYAPEKWNGNGLYHGTGEAFLFKFVQENGKEEILYYPWTGANSYFMICKKKGQPYIGMGGGDGKFGLWIEESLQNGSSNSCATFGNPQLSTSQNFQILFLEVWGVSKA